MVVRKKRKRGRMEVCKWKATRQTYEEKRERRTWLPPLPPLLLLALPLPLPFLLHLHLYLHLTSLLLHYLSRTKASTRMQQRMPLLFSRLLSHLPPFLAAHRLQPILPNSVQARFRPVQTRLPPPPFLPLPLLLRRSQLSRATPFRSDYASRLLLLLSLSRQHSKEVVVPPPPLLPRRTSCCRVQVEEGGESPAPPPRCRHPPPVRSPEGRGGGQEGYSPLHLTC
mmetsp:Transcript_7726/g.20060  ORF Transcript_7726/g.20060 Transcript_7726/m.20060 type:complete len:225 (-) Transcript_7726:314-988(-)